MNFRDIQKYIVFVSLVYFLYSGLASDSARNVLLIILIVMSVYIFKAINYFGRAVITEIFILLVLNTFYYIYSPKIIELSNGVHWGTTGFYSNIGMNLGIFFFSFFISLHRRLKDQTLKILFVFMFIATALRFYETRDQIAIDYDGRMRTMNVAYDFVILLPYLFLFRNNRYLPLIFMLSTIFFVVYSCKRGAMLMLAVGCIYIIYNLYLKNSKRNIFTNCLIVIILLVGARMIIGDIIQNNYLLSYKFQLAMDGDANGRNRIFEITWNYWANCHKLKNYLFGFGFCTSVKVVGNYAHNDWLELISMSGLLGVFIYLLLFIRLLYFATKKIQLQWHRFAIFLIIILWLMKSFYSMAYCSIGNMPMLLLLGYLVGTNQEKLKNK